MKSRAALLFSAMLTLSGAQGQEYRTAKPGYTYSFPRDHFSHPEFQTEWWYYTGNLLSGDGHRFGFELTFFRQGTDRAKEKQSPWDVEDIYVAHLSLTDVEGGRFRFEQRVNRAGPGIAGASEATGRIWNGNWSVAIQGETQTLEAVGKEFSLQFKLLAEKPPTINGVNGVSQKAAAAGKASHYISMTRFEATGNIELKGKNTAVKGFAWMDHEFFTNQLEKDQIGWDWLSIQLGDKSELMLYRIRRNDGSVDPFSAGTYVDPQGKSQHLTTKDFTLEPESARWVSPATSARYPIKWKISVPNLAFDFEAVALLNEQELTSRGRLLPNYWEGAIAVNGTRNGSPLHGVGYLEMTGYDKHVTLSQ